jgi:hypothetical protein
LDESEGLTSKVCEANQELGNSEQTRGSVEAGSSWEEEAQVPPPVAGPSSRSSASDNLNATHICNTLSCDVNVVRSFPAPVWADDEAAWLGPVPGGAADGLDMRLVSNE